MCPRADTMECSQKGETILKALLLESATEPLYGALGKNECFNYTNLPTLKKHANQKKYRCATIYFIVMAVPKSKTS